MGFSRKNLRYSPFYRFFCCTRNSRPHARPCSTTSHGVLGNVRHRLEIFGLQRQAQTNNAVRCCPRTPPRFKRVWIPNSSIPCKQHRTVFLAKFCCDPKLNPCLVYEGWCGGQTSLRSDVVIGAVWLFERFGFRSKPRAIRNPWWYCRRN